MTHQTTAVTKDDFNRVNAPRTGMDYSEVNAKQKADKTFEELVEESIRLPELSPSNHLPMTMTEILRNAKQGKDITTKLPQIHSGQVQLVSRSDGLKSERKRRRGKKAKVHHRPERQSPRAAPEINSNSVRVAYSKPTSTDLSTKGANTEQAHWKKKLHRRQSKRHMAEEGDPMNVSITITGYQHYKEYRT